MLLSPDEREPTDDIELLVYKSIDPIETLSSDVAVDSQGDELGSTPKDNTVRISHYFNVIVFFFNFFFSLCRRPTTESSAILY